MKKIFKIEVVYEGSSIYYALYQKRFLWTWKFISKFIHKGEAKRIAYELSQHPIYFK